MTSIMSPNALAPIKRFAFLAAYLTALNTLINDSYYSEMFYTFARSAGSLRREQIVMAASSTLTSTCFLKFLIMKTLSDNWIFIMELVSIYLFIFIYLFLTKH